MGARCKEQERQQVAEPEDKWQLAFDKLPDQEKVDTLLLFGKEKTVTDQSLEDRVEWMECIENWIERR